MTNPFAAKDKIEAVSRRVHAAPGVGLFERLEVIDDPRPRSAALNMAADETLLEQVADVPLLRIYRWERPALSFGCFTVFREIHRPHDDKRDLVRRWTGGGIVEHGADFTYSLIIPRRHLGALGPPGGSYAMIHEALGSALSRTGVEAMPVDNLGEPSRSTPASYCFENPVPHDLMIAGRKAAGAAQRRTRRGLLHQGSVQDSGAAAGWQERLANSLPGALCSGHAERRFTPAEEDAARRLAKTKYGTQAWLFRR